MLSKKYWLIALLISVCGLLGLSACEISDVNKQNSLSSGTTSGYGSSGNPAAHIILYAANNYLASGATTTLTVIVTDGSGRRTDASIILTSSRGATFNGTEATLIGTTSGGAFIADYKAANNAGEDEVTATVAGTALKATTVISVY